MSRAEEVERSARALLDMFDSEGRLMTSSVSAGRLRALNAMRSALSLPAPTVEAGEGEVLRYVKGIARQNTYEERAEKWHSENEGDYEGGEDLEDIYDKVILDARAVLAHLHDTTKGGEGGGA